MTKTAVSSWLPASDRVALVLPTSLCSGQIASLIAQKLNAAPDKPFTRAVALPHTEGCGNSAGESEKLFMRTMAGYLTHPLVAKAVLLEHGCEKTHNDAFRHILKDLQIDTSRFGFASIQLDGGIERVTRKVLKQFAELPTQAHASVKGIGFVAPNPTTFELRVMAQLSRISGIATVVPSALSLDGKQIEYGQRISQPGAYSMQTPTEDIAETITGLGATGVQFIIIFNSDWPVPGNPLVPTIQVAARERIPPALKKDVDLTYSENEGPESVAQSLLVLLSEIHSGKRKAKSAELGNTTFQITRGYTGISL